MSLKNYFASMYPDKKMKKQNNTSYSSKKEKYNEEYKQDFSLKSERKPVMYENIGKTHKKEKFNNNTLNTEKIIYITAILTLLFFLITNNYTYNFTSNLFKINIEDKIPFKLLLIHTIIFFILSFIIINLLV